MIHYDMAFCMKKRIALEHAPWFTMFVTEVEVVVMNTKEVVELMDISQDTLRYYEKVGVIPPVERDKNGYRIYQMKDLNWIYLVKHLRQAGVTIELLVEFCRLGQLPKDEAVQNQQKEVLNKQLEELDEHLKAIHNARELLKYKIETYDDHIAKINDEVAQEYNLKKIWENKRQ